MLVPPSQPSSADVLEAVQAHWFPEANHVEYLPVGFGSHHWRAARNSAPLGFITLDTPDEDLFPSSCEEAYAAAGQLAEVGFSHVVSPLRADTGDFTVSCAEGLLSACPWVTGRTPSEDEARAPQHVYAVAGVLRALHTLRPPSAAPVWSPQVGLGSTERLDLLSAEAWDRGPWGDDARRLIRTRLVSVGQWEARYVELAEAAERRRKQWVLTHGEPHFANQIVTEQELLLVDWETCAVAPAERDLRALPAAFHAEWGTDIDMLELFDLEWRLSEIQEYAHWFRGSHQGNEDDLIAFEGLTEELSA